MAGMHVKDDRQVESEVKKTSQGATTTDIKHQRRYGVGDEL